MQRIVTPFGFRSSAAEVARRRLVAIDGEASG